MANEPTPLTATDFATKGYVDTLVQSGFTGSTITLTGAFAGVAGTFTGAVVLSNASVKMTAIPTSDPHVVGQLWANSGVLTVSAGP